MTKKKTAKSKKPIERLKKIVKNKKTDGTPIKWNVPENMISRYATHMTVQLLENEFKLAFFELSPEIRIDPKLPSSKEVQANCVGSVIVNVAKVPSIIEVLKRQLDLYISRHSPEKPEVK